MKYKHALFLNPYTPGNSSRDSIRGLFPPTGLEYVATSAKGLAGKITLIDMMHEKELSSTGKLLDFMSGGIDIVCVGIGWDRQLREVFDLLNRMPEGMPLVVGGYKATEIVEDIFEACPKVDIIVRGEGEETIKDILKGAPLEGIRGISYRKNGSVTHNENRPLPDVNGIKAPDRSLRRVEYRLMLNDVNVTNVTYDTVLGARGCPYNCKFCTFDLNPLGQKRSYSARSAESVVEEIEGITADAVLFSDDNFFTNVRRAENICDLIISRGIKKRFIAQARIDIAGYPELLGKMVKAGFKLLLLGLESPSDRILAQFDKGFTSAAVREAFTALRKYPIYYHGYFIYGNIGETEKEMLYIAQFAKEIRVDSITYSKLRIERFSPLKELAEKTPGYYIGDGGTLYSDKYDQAALKRIGSRINFSFYTPLTLLRIVKKFFIIRFFTFKEILSVLFTSPKFLAGVIARQVRKGQLGDSMKRIFIKNA